MEGEADENGDGIVTADELPDYVHRNVREATSEGLGSRTPPSEQGSFDPTCCWPMFPAGARPGAPPPAKEGALIFESNMDGVEVFLDGKSVGVVNKGKALHAARPAPGTHTVQGVKMGYEPDGPREETVYPGRDTTVSIKIMIARRRNRAAVDALDKGLGVLQEGYEREL